MVCKFYDFDVELCENIDYYFQLPEYVQESFLTSGNDVRGYNALWMNKSWVTTPGGPSYVLPRGDVQRRHRIEHAGDGKFRIRSVDNGSLLFYNGGGGDVYWQAQCENDQPIGDPTVCNAYAKTNYTDWVLRKGDGQLLQLKPAFLFRPFDTMFGLTGSFTPYSHSDASFKDRNGIRITAAP